MLGKLKSLDKIIELEALVNLQKESQDTIHAELPSQNKLILVCGAIKSVQLFVICDHVLQWGIFFFYLQNF